LHPEFFVLKQVITDHIHLLRRAVDRDVHFFFNDFCR
jgi:hypothetical protein